jgi:PKD domain
MNPIRNVIPTETATVRSRLRATRVASAVTMFTGLLLGAISCADNGATQPLKPVTDQPPYTVAPDSLKHPPQRSSAARVPSASMSAAGAAGAAGPSMSAASTRVDADMTVSSIPFNAEPGSLANGGFDANDDATWGGPTGFDIGFNFSFFGVTQTKFWIGSNGVILFRNADGTAPDQYGGCCYLWLPSDDAVNNVIALANSDLVPGDGQVTYETRGAAPNRRLIVNFQSVPLFGDMGSVTTQAVLYEGSNVIEVHTTSQVGDLTFTQGVENANGSRAVFLTGRNQEFYALDHDAVRFTPVVGNTPPTADAGGNAGTAPFRRYEGREGAAIQFKGSGADADNDQITYSWDFNKDGVADAETAEASYTYADNGTYVATLTVTDSHGAIGQASVDVIVKNVAPSVDAGADIRILAGQTANFTGRFSDPGVNDAPWGWTWNFGSLGSDYSTTSDQSAAVLASRRFCKVGSYTAQFTVVDKNGDAGADAAVVTVDAIPVQIELKPTKIVLNDKENGKMSVKIFSRPGVDATAINPSSVRLTNGTGRGTPLARTGGGLWQWKTDADLNGDGLRDADAQFNRDEMLANGDLQMNTTKLLLKGDLGECGEVLGSADVVVTVKAKDKSAASSMQTPGAPQP